MKLPMNMVVVILVLTYCLLGLAALELEPKATEVFEVSGELKQAGHNYLWEYNHFYIGSNEFALYTTNPEVLRKLQDLNKKKVTVTVKVED